MTRVQYAATAHTPVLQDAQVQISMADKGEAWQNSYAERLIRTVKEEGVDLSEYLNYHDAYHHNGDDTIDATLETEGATTIQSMPQVPFGPHKISHLILGGNPINGGH